MKNEQDGISSIARIKSAEYYGKGVPFDKPNYEYGFCDGYDYNKQQSIEIINKQIISFYNGTQTINSAAQNVQQG